MLDALRQDLTFGLRAFRKSPGFAAVVVLTLSLGIGATTAIFSVVRGVILKPLPYPESHRLVWLTHSIPGLPGVTTNRQSVSPGLYHQYRTLSRSLEDVALYRVLEGSLAGDGEPERVYAIMATHSMFQMLGVPPLIGRWFGQADVEPPPDPNEERQGMVVLSHGLWARRYGSDPSILGRTITVNEFAVEVIGVMPPDFAFPSPDAQLWFPWGMRNPPRGFGGFSGIRGVGRLKPGVSPERAEVDLNSLIPGTLEAFPGEFAERLVNDGRLQAHVEPLKDHLVGEVTQTLWIVLGTVAFVLLIACANVANLFLVRADARQREMAVRTALGAGHRRLARHCLAESILMAGVGGLLGLGLAIVGVRALVRLGPVSLPRLHEVGMDMSALAFTAAISILAGISFGLIAAFRPTGAMLASLKESTRGSTSGRGQFRTRHVLVMSQVAFALVLLVGSGLMIRSFWHLKNVDPGFDARSVLTFELRATRAFEGRDGVVEFHEQLLDRLMGLPGVQAAGGVTCLPLRGVVSGCNARTTLIEEGFASATSELGPAIRTVTVTPGYFETMRIPLMAGTTVERPERDSLGANVVVSAALARDYWPREDPIGKRVFPTVAPGISPPRWYTIVGVVGDVNYFNLTDDRDGEWGRLLYFPDGARGSPGSRAMTIVMRTATPPLELVEAVRNTVRSLDANVPVAHIQTMEGVMSSARAQMAFTMVLLAIAGMVALALESIGIYGVLAYVVSQRTSEIGIRMALGARPADVRHMIMRQGGAVVLVGLGIGLAGAFTLTRVMEAVLFNVSPTDPATYIGVSIGLLAIALLATYVPARKAAGANPADALRVE